jgi:hypothetical protein
VLAGLVNGDAVGGAGGRCGEEEDQKRDLNRNPEWIEERAPGIAGRTDASVPTRAGTIFASVTAAFQRSIPTF